MIRPAAYLIAVMVLVGPACIPTLPPAPAAGSGSDSGDRFDGDTSVVPRSDASDTAPDDGRAGDAEATNDVSPADDGSGGCVSCTADEVEVGCTCVEGHPGLADLVNRCEVAGTPLGWPRPEPSAGPGSTDVLADTDASEVEIDTPLSSPFVIDTPGEYLVTADVAAEHGAIHITAGGVLLDLGGHTITYGTSDAAAGNPTFGVYVETADASDIVVTNGRLVQGDGMCDRRESVTRCAALRLESGGDVALHGLEVRPASPGAYGVWASHSGRLTVQNCRFPEQAPRGSMMTHSSVRAAQVGDLLVTSSVFRNVKDTAISMSEGEVRGNHFAFGDDTSHAAAVGVSLTSNPPEIVGNVFVGRGGGPVAVRGSVVTVRSNYFDMENDAPGADGTSAGALGVDHLGGAVATRAICNWFDVGAGAVVDGASQVPFGGRAWGIGATFGQAALVEDNFFRAYDSSGGSALAVPVATVASANQTTEFRGNVITGTTGVVLRGRSDRPADEMPRFESNHFDVADGALVAEYPGELGEGVAAHGAFSGNDWSGRDPCDPAQLALSDNCLDAASDLVNRRVTFDPADGSACTYSNVAGEQNGTIVAPGCELYLETD